MWDFNNYSLVAIDSLRTYYCVNYEEYPRLFRALSTIMLIYLDLRVLWTMSRYWFSSDLDATFMSRRSSECAWHGPEKTQKILSSHEFDFV